MVRLRYDISGRGRCVAVWALAAFLIAGLGGLLAASPAEAAVGKFEPPDGYTYTGVDANQQSSDGSLDPNDPNNPNIKKWDEWTNLMGGKPAAISHTFEGFDTWMNFDCGVASLRNATPLITWQTGKTSPEDIANAQATANGTRTDEVLLRNAWLLATHEDCRDKPIFLRIDQEMNAYWFGWGPYDSSGNLSKGFTPEDFKKMWKRMVIVLRGGSVADINAALAAEGLPKLDPNVSMPSWMGLPSTTDDNGAFPSASNVAFVWNPHDSPGQPDVAGNRWLDYYPGDGYVDWVGQSTYNSLWPSGIQKVSTIDERFRWLDAFYEEFSVKRGKPYMMGEWGLDPKPDYASADNPEYINRMLGWAEGKPKVKALVYFSVLEGDGDDFRLSSYPNSAQALAAGLKKERYLAGLTAIDSGPSGPTNSGTASFAFSSPEPSVSFQCSLDGAAWSSCTSPKGYTGLPEGSHALKVRSVDAAGRPEAYPAGRTWTVDTAAPTVADVYTRTRARRRVSASVPTSL